MEAFESPWWAHPNLSYLAYCHPTVKTGFAEL
jgi:hypothetical protein